MDLSWSQLIRNLSFSSAHPKSRKVGTLYIAINVINIIIKIDTASHSLLYLLIQNSVMAPTSTFS